MLAFVAIVIVRIEVLQGEKEHLILAGSSSLVCYGSDVLHMAFLTATSWGLS